MRAIGTIIVLVAAALIAGADGWWETENANVQAAGDGARSAVVAVEAYLGDVERQLAWLVRSRADVTRETDIAYVLSTTPAITRLQVLDRTGAVLAAAARPGAAEPNAAAQRRTMLAAEPNVPALSPVRRDGGGRPRATLGIAAADGAVIALADLDLDFVGGVLDGIDLPTGTAMLLTDEAGTPIAGTTTMRQAAIDIPLPALGWRLRAERNRAWPGLGPLLARALLLVGFAGVCFWVRRRSITPP